MTQYYWADGFHAPKNVSADDAMAAIERLKEPTPENLLEASKSKKHILHETLWAEGDQVWANRGRLECCRKIIASVCEVEVVGGREIAIRAVEFVRANGDGRWATLTDIKKDPDLMDAYLAEVLRLQEQASAKLKKVRALMAPRVLEAA